MTNLDDLLLEQSIRRRVGDPGTVTRIDRSDESLLGRFRTVAEHVSGAEVELVTVTDGIPGHFSLRGESVHSVIFHHRQVEVCAFLRDFTLDQRLDDSLIQQTFEGVVLRLIAEFLLQSGHGDQALATLARSHAVGSAVTIRRPTLTDIEAWPHDERYLVEWLFALGHEIGHNLTPEVKNSLAELPFIDQETIATLVATIMERRFPPSAVRTLLDIVARGDLDKGPKSHAGTDILLAETVADVFSLVCLSEAWPAAVPDDSDAGTSGRGRGVSATKRVS